MKDLMNISLVFGEFHVSGKKLWHQKCCNAESDFWTDLHIRQNETLTVSEFDRGPSNPRYLLVLFLRKKYDLHMVGHREGRLINKYTTTVLSLVTEKLLSPQ